MLEFLPLILALLAVGVVLAAPFHRGLDRAVTRLAYLVFNGAAVDGDARRVRELRAAAIGVPYRVYVTRTRLYVAVAALVASVIGVYLAQLLLTSLSVATLTFPGGDALGRLPRILRTNTVKRFVVYLFAAFSLGGLAATTVYAARWEFPSMRASARRRQIDATLPRMVAFVYALSRGGMAFPDVMRALSRHRGVFGPGAEDVTVGVREIDLFGADVITSVRRVSQRTPSDGFQQFTENLANVLQSGRDLAEFLHDQYERHREQAVEQQREVLDLLATTAEIYVTVVVAGMLFLVTILVVIGLTGGGTLDLVRLLTYATLPAANLLFVAYLAEVTQPLRASREREVDVRPAARHATPGEQALGQATGTAGVADGGVSLDAGVQGRARANLARLRAYRRFGRLRSRLSSPLVALQERPELLLILTVPIAVSYVLWRLTGTGVELRVIDDPLVHATLFVFGTYAVGREMRRRQLRRIEAGVPDLLDRLASLNEAGVSVVSSFERARGSDLGALDDEVERIWRDIQWGATVEEAMTNFGHRVQTPAITRTVTLITSAMSASNEIGPVLRIAAEQARSDRRLRRHRRQEMFTYLIVIYVAFVVFLIVIAAIDTVLVPSLPSGTQLGPTVATGTPTAFIGSGARNEEAYRLVFTHAALIQAGLSGLVAGQMSSATLRDGVKHAAIMIGVAYLVLLIL